MWLFLQKKFVTVKRGDFFNKLSYENPKYVIGLIWTGRNLGAQGTSVGASSRAPARRIWKYYKNLCFTRITRWNKLLSGFNILFKIY